MCTVRTNEVLPKNVLFFMTKSLALVTLIPKANAPENRLSWITPPKDLFDPNRWSENQASGPRAYLG